MTTLPTFLMPDVAPPDKLPAVSHSALDLFRKSVPRYYAKHVLKTVAYEPSTPAQLVGLGLHARLFGGPAVVRRPEFKGKGARAARAEFEAAHAKDVVLPPAEYDLVTAMAEAARSDPDAAALLAEAGPPEKHCRWEDRQTGLACYARFDKVLPREAETVVLDAKSISGDPDPDNFSRAVWNNGYHTQAEWYLRGAAAAYPGRPARFVWVVISKEPPHETVLREPSPAMLRYAARQNGGALAELLACRNAGKWRSRWAGCREVDLPRWVR